jgi:cobalamin synthase
MKVFKPTRSCRAGCFHEDGLADTIDGFGGGWAPKEILAIMKDSRVGTYALVGTALAQHLKLRCLSMLPNPVAALVVAHCASRWVVLPVQHFSVYIQVSLLSFVFHIICVVSCSLVHTYKLKPKG